MSILYRVEDFYENHIEGPVVELTFDTKYRGKWQCRCTGNQIKEYNSEPPFESLTKEEQKQIKQIAQYVHYITFADDNNI